jgi:polyisoprenoid-binding protein YceI
MKKIFSAAFIVSSLMLASCGEAKKEPTVAAPASPLAGDVTLTADPSASVVKWRGDMAGLAVYSHEGTVKLKDGKVQLKDGKVTGGSFTIDLTSMVPTDANYKPEEGRSPENLVKHLSDTAFFDTQNYPTATFVINSVSGNEAKGTLTVRGKSNEETLKNIAVVQDGENVKLTGDVTFDRQKYGVAYKAAKDYLLADDIAINVELVGKK